MKKKIIIISGYYPTNGVLSLINYFAYSLISNKNFTSKYDLKILVFEENFILKFKKFLFNTYLILKNFFLNQNNRIHSYAYSVKQFINDNPKIKKNIFSYSNEKDIKNFNPSLIFPVYFSIKNYNFNTIGYLYDFQHIDLPKLFSKHEINLRNKIFLYILKSNKYVLVNSNLIKKKAQIKYNNKRIKFLKIPFLPFIIENSKKVNFENLKEKYGIKKNYFIICNQFWKHKNYDTAFEAFKKFLNFYPDYQLVCTGDKKDTRYPLYFKNLTKRYEYQIQKNNILVLGVISKLEQMCLLEKSNAVIQPTLYEGGPGGFSAYEAIALKKKLIISNIPINKEINYKNAIFFKNKSAKDLLKKLLMISKRKNLEVEKRSVFKSSNRNKKELGNFLLNLINKNI